MKTPLLYCLRQSQTYPQVHLALNCIKAQMLTPKFTKKHAESPLDPKVLFYILNSERNPLDIETILFIRDFGKDDIQARVGLCTVLK